MSVVCQINCVGGITRPTSMLKVVLGGKDCDTRVIDFDYALEQLLHRRKRNVHLEIRNLKQTELQRLNNRGKKG